MTQEPVVGCGITRVWSSEGSHSLSYLLQKKPACVICRCVRRRRPSVRFNLSRFFHFFSLCPTFSQMEVDKVVCLPRLSRVAVCGGTHGNELSGVYLVRELLKEAKEEEEKEDRPPSVMLVLSNPWAVQQCRRYVSTDLNRCFTHAMLK